MCECPDRRGLRTVELGGLFLRVIGMSLEGRSILALWDGQCVIAYQVSSFSVVRSPRLVGSDVMVGKLVLGNLYLWDFGPVHAQFNYYSRISVRIRRH